MLKRPTKTGLDVYKRQAVALKFVVILFCDLSKSEFDKVEIQNGGKIAVQILERLDFLCFFHQVFLFCFQFCTLLVQLAKGVIQTMDTVDVYKRQVLP